MGIGFGEAGIAVVAPLHRRSNAVTVGEKDVVAHPDLVPVVDHRGAGERQQEAVEEFDSASIVLEQRSETPTNPEIEARPAIGGVRPPHQVPFLFRHHLEREFVVIAEEDRPLRVRRDRRGLLEDVDDRQAILALKGEVQAGHEGKVERHVTLVVVPEVRR